MTPKPGFLFKLVSYTESKSVRLEIHFDVPCYAEGIALFLKKERKEDIKIKTKRGVT